jgi:ABC-type transport system involved in cytochrome bd biosynthesis fused ATPase/permease subunit
VKPLDPRLLRRVRPVRAFVTLTAGAGVVTAGLVVAQAYLLSRVVARAFTERETLAVLAPLLWGLVVVVAGRAVLAWATETLAVRTSARVRSELVEHALRPGPRDPRLPSTGELGTLATRGVDALDGYLRRYLPALLLATTAPLLVGV